MWVPSRRQVHGIQAHDKHECSNCMQFAHGEEELVRIKRHPKYKTQARCSQLHASFHVYNPATVSADAHISTDM